MVNSFFSKVSCSSIYSHSKNTAPINSAPRSSSLYSYIRITTVAVFLLLNILNQIAIDQHLTWQQHIDHIVSAARAWLYHFRHLHLSIYLFGLMYQVFIIPLFDYCVVVWTPCLAQQIKAVERIHPKVTSTVQHWTIFMLLLHIGGASQIPYTCTGLQNTTPDGSSILAGVVSIFCCSYWSSRS